MVAIFHVDSTTSSIPTDSSLSELALLRDWDIDGKIYR